MTEDEISVPKQGEVVAATSGAEQPRRRRRSKSTHFHVSRSNRELSRDFLLMGLCVLLILLLWYVMVSQPSV